MTLELLLVGVASSAFTEVYTWINKKLTGTLLEGKGAFLLSALIALIAALVRLFTTTTYFSFSNIFTYFSEIWVWSQAFFLVVIKTLNIDTK